MHLKLRELQRVVKRTIKEERSHTVLRDELCRVLGPSILGSDNFSRIAELANERLDYLEATGSPVRREDFRISALTEALGSDSPHVRKLAARLLPAKMAAPLLDDRSSIVRCAAARRLPFELVRESVRRHPTDDQLRTIARAKKLDEAGLPKPSEQEPHLDIYGDEPLGDAVKTQSPLKDFPDTWYERLARKLCKEYGTNLEGQWEEILATRVAASHLSVGVTIDRNKLLKAIYDCIEEREEALLGEGSLAALRHRLLRESHLDDAVMPVIEEAADPVAELLESSTSSSEYVERAEKLFSVRKAAVPPGIKKYRIGEGYKFDTHVPVNGRVPGTHSVVTERALDRYVDSWNAVQSRSGEPYRLSWAPHPIAVDMVSFNLELK